MAEAYHKLLLKPSQLNELLKSERLFSYLSCPMYIYRLILSRALWQNVTFSGLILSNINVFLSAFFPTLKELK